MSGAISIFLELSIVNLLDEPRVGPWKSDGGNNGDRRSKAIPALSLAGLLHPHNRQAGDDDIVNEADFVELLYCCGDFSFVARVSCNEFAFGRRPRGNATPRFNEAGAKSERSALAE